MLRPLLAAAVLFSLSLTPSVQAASSSQTANFRQLYGESYRLETDFGVLELFLDDQGATQIQGHMKDDTNSTWSSVDARGIDPSNHTYFSERELGEVDGQAFLKFKAPDEEIEIMVVNNYGVDRMPDYLLDFWRQTVPGCIVEMNGKLKMPTAVVMITPAGLQVVGAFVEIVPIK
jgi:hypothetical protein